MDAEALSDEERARLHAALLALEEELAALSESRSGRDAARPVDLDDPIGRVSRIDAIQQQQMQQANRAALVRRLQAVRAALARFAEDRYGDCVGCGEPVGLARLEARPESPFCIRCQNRREAR